MAKFNLNTDAKTLLHHSLLPEFCIIPSETIAAHWSLTERLSDKIPDLLRCHTTEHVQTFYLVMFL